MTAVSVMLRKVVAVLSVLLVLGGVLGSVPAYAQQPPRPIPHGPPGAGFAAGPPRASQDNPAGRAHLNIRVVYANHSGQVDPRVAGLQKQLGSIGFTGFQLLSTHEAQLAAGQDTSVNVEGGQKIDLTLISRNDNAVKVRIQLERNGKTIVDTTASVQPDHNLTVGGWTYQDGKLFVLIKAD